jgi:hypothetical protein
MTRINITDLKERITRASPLAENLALTLTLDECNFLLDCIGKATKPPPMTAYLDPGNYLGRIEHLWAFLSSDEGGEGVCAAPIGGLGAMPLIAADEARLKSIRHYAQHIASVFGKPVRLAKFTTREDIEIL